jgi:hypothetical protein
VGTSGVDGGPIASCYLAGCRAADVTWAGGTKMSGEDVNGADCTLFTDRTQVFGGSVVLYDNVWRGATAVLQVSGTGVAEMNGGCFFGCTSTPLTVYNGPSARMFIRVKMFGNCTGTPLFQIDGGCAVVATANTVLPNITGPATFAVIGGTSKTSGNLASSFVNPTNGAAFVYPTS